MIQEIGELEQKTEQAMDILGVTPDVFFETIREKYHKLILKYHPDRNPDNPKAAEKCIEIINAYDHLCSLNNQQKTEEELITEQHIWDLFKEFWPVSQEYQTSIKKSPRQSSFPKSEHKQPYTEFVNQHGFYDFVKPD